MVSDAFTGETDPPASVEQAIGPYLRAVLRHWRLVAAVTLIALAAAAFTLSRVGQSYQASASILVSPLVQTNSSFLGIGTVVSTGDPARDVQTAAALIDTPEAAAEAARRLGPAWSTNDVMNAVTVTPRGASDVLAVTAEASSAGDAARVANAYAASAVAYRARIVQAQIATELTLLDARLAIIKNSPGSAEATAIATTIAQLRAAQGAGREPTMTVSQQAQPPDSPTGAPRWLILLLAAVAGFVLASMAALGLETFARPVRDRDEVSKLFPIPVLATVPRIARRLRRGGLPPWEFPPAAFEQMRMLRVQLSVAAPQRQRPRRGREEQAPVIMVTSAGASDGKTTIAAALAAAFAEVDEGVIVIDLDFRKPGMTKLLQIDGRERTSTVDSSLPAGALLPVPMLPGVKVLPAPEGDLAQFEIVVRHLPDLLSRARRLAACVIIDTPPVGEVSEALRIAPLCDLVVFVSRPRHTDRRRVILARDLLTRVNARMAGMVLVGRDTGNISGGDYGYESSFSWNGVGDEEEVQPSMSSAGVETSGDVEDR